MSTLNVFLKDIADAIREKKGTTASINAQNFSSEIRSIETGGGTVNGGNTGTPVPNEGYVEKVYFNTNLSVEEVCSIINSNVDSDGVNVLLINQERSVSIGLLSVEGIFAIMDDINETYYFLSQDVMGLGFVGWNPDITYPIAINSEVVNEIGGTNVGSQNDKLSNLFSITPFVKGGSSDLVKVGEMQNINVVVKSDFNDYPCSLGVAFKGINGFMPNITYYVVDSLPSEPNFTNAQTFETAHVYIQQDIPYIYTNVGYGDMWLDVATMVNSLMSTTLYKNVGYVENMNFMDSFSVGVMYDKVVYELQEERSTVVRNGLDYEKIFDKSIKVLDNSELKYIPEYAFVNCYNLTTVNLPQVTYIGGGAFQQCVELTTVLLPKVARFSYQIFNGCSQLTDIYIGYSGVVELAGYYPFNNCPNTKVHVRAEYLAQYQADTNWTQAVSKGWITLVGDYTD